MLTNRLKGIIITFVVLILLASGLYVGFNSGYKFILNQDELEKVAKQAEIAEQNPNQTKPTETDTDGSELTQKTEATGKNDIRPPRHIKKDTPGAVEISIKSGWGTSEIAEALMAKGIIDEKLPFSVMAKLNGFSASYQMGTHYVLKGMDYNEIMYNLSLPAERAKIIFYEGFSYIDIKNALRKEGVNFNEEKMDSLVKNSSIFADYSFIRNLPTDQKERIFFLEGYLFPDTYSFDLNADEEEIIRTFLSNTENKLDNEKFKERAEYMGMTMDEVITLASVIQNEAGTPLEMYKVSRVFHNRMDNEDLLQSCATINYLRQLEGLPKVWYATQEEAARDSHYNTYKYAGLPAGPICNPGLEAIQAALYPDIKEPYVYYFVAKGDGTNAFATNLADHEANIAQYEDNWTNERIY